MVRIFILAILAFALCSCADFKGFHLKPAADGDRDGFGHGYVSGSGDPTYSSSINSLERLGCDVLQSERGAPVRVRLMPVALAWPNSALRS